MCDQNFCHTNNQNHLKPNLLHTSDWNLEYKMIEPN
jgi:hypothetical protein